MNVDWSEEPLGPHHDREAFDCGQADLNEYLRRYARQNHERGGAKTFVATAETDPSRILGYYSLSPCSVRFDDVSTALRRRLGRYPVPAYLLARLAVDRTAQGRGLGSALFFAAGRRAWRAAQLAGGVLLYVEAKDDAAARWYERFGAERFANPLALGIPLSTFAEDAR